MTDVSMRDARAVHVFDLIPVESLARILMLVEVAPVLHVCISFARSIRSLDNERSRPFTSSASSRGRVRDVTRVVSDVPVLCSLAVVGFDNQPLDDVVRS